MKKAIQGSIGFAVLSWVTALPIMDKAEAVTFGDILLGLISATAAVLAVGVLFIGALEKAFD